MSTRICAAALFTLSFAAKLYAFSGSPPDVLNCEAPAEIGNFEHERCWISKDNSLYVPENSPSDHPVSFTHTPNLPSDASLQLKINMPGYNPRPDHCHRPDVSAAAGFVQVDVCASHYPDLGAYRVGNAVPFGWRGAFFGLSHHWRVGLALSHAYFEHMDAVDIAAGVYVSGASYGGTGALLMPVMMRNIDPWWADLISVVRADVPNTLFVKEENPKGMYYRNPVVQIAWDGVPPAIGDFRLAAEQGFLDHIYFRVNGSPADVVVSFDTQIFDYCDQARLACFGTWHDAGHVSSEAGVNLPFSALYSGPNQEVRLDRMLPVFTYSSANHSGPRGHYNLGLEWNAAGPNFQDTPELASVPIRYRRHTNIGANVPDQPPAATFDFTLRRSKQFELAVGDSIHYLVAGQEGDVVVTKAGEVTIEGITLDHSENYRVLRLTRNSL